MSALSTYVGTTELTELVPTEVIPTILDSYPYTSFVGRLICRRVQGTGSIAQRFPRWNAVSVPAGNKAESDTFTDVNIDTTESTVTPGIVGLRLPISIEAEVMTVLGPQIERAVLDEVVNGIMNRRDSDILSSNTSATNTTGAVTDNFDTGKLRSALAAARALHMLDSGLVALVLHDDGYRDLEESMGASAATLMAKHAGTLDFSATNGFQGYYGGGNVAIFSTSNAPAESSNWSGCITPIGAKSGLGFVESRDISHLPSQGDDASVRLAKYHNLWCWYGVGVANPGQLLEVLHRT